MRTLRLVALVAFGTVVACDSTECGPGFVFQDGDCVEITTRVDCDPPCGEHQRCDMSTRECRCVPGYAGDPCAWAGALRDPDFMEADAWSTTNGTTLLETARGAGDDLGVAFLGPSAVCSGGRASQVVEMPRFEDAEPLVATLVYRSPESWVDVGFGESFHPLPASVADPELDDWTPARFCLGEAAYGDLVEVQVTSFERITACFDEPTDTVEFDRLAFEVAADGECPDPGFVLNGDADVDAGGWFFSAGRGLAVARLESGVGRDGTDGARLFEEQDRGSEASMGTQLSVPLANSLPSPALKFWWKATAEADFSVYLGTSGLLRYIDVLEGDGTDNEHIYCLPPWTQGIVVELLFERRRSVTNAELVVDDVRLVSDARCGTSSDLLDPSFDSAPNRWPGVRVSGDGETVRVVDDPQNAWSPPGVLEITYTTNVQTPQFETWVRVPNSSGDRGPQLRFRARVPQQPRTPIRWLLGRAAEIRGDLTTVTGIWRPQEVCLPPEWAGRWFRFQIGAGPKAQADPFATFDPPARILVDDLELTTSLSCRAR